MGVMASPLTGADGNVEFLLHARTGPASARTDVDATLLDEAARRGGGALMAAIGFVLHHERAQAADLAREAAAWLQDEGHEVRMPAARRRHRGPGVARVRRGGARPRASTSR